MSKETRVMWFGSFLGGLVLLLFGAVGFTQYYKSLGIKGRSDKDSSDERARK